VLAQHDRRPRLAAIELGSQLLGQLARNPAELGAIRQHLDGVRIVLVAGIAPELERVAGLDSGSNEGLGVVLASSRDAGNV
jgi:hypothetical protein